MPRRATAPAASRAPAPHEREVPNDPTRAQEHTRANPPPPIEILHAHTRMLCIAVIKLQSLMQSDTPDWERVGHTTKAVSEAQRAILTQWGIESQTDTLRHYDTPDIDAVTYGGIGYPSWHHAVARCYVGNGRRESLLIFDQGNRYYPPEELNWTKSDLGLEREELKHFRNRETLWRKLRIVAGYASLKKGEPDPAIHRGKGWEWLNPKGMIAAIIAMLDKEHRRAVRAMQPRVSTGGPVSRLIVNLEQKTAHLDSREVASNLHPDAALYLAAIIDAHPHPIRSKDIEQRSRGLRGKKLSRVRAKLPPKLASLIESNHSGHYLKLP